MLKMLLLARLFNRKDTINYIMKYDRTKIDIYDLCLGQLKVINGGINVT
jgi:hypothetical protein